MYVKTKWSFEVVVTSVRHVFYPRGGPWHRVAAESWALLEELKLQACRLEARVQACRLAGLQAEAWIWLACWLAGLQAWRLGGLEWFGVIAGWRDSWIGAALQHARRSEWSADFIEFHRF